MFFFLLNGSLKTVKVKTEYYHSKKNWIYIKFGRGKYDAKKSENWEELNKKQR